MTDSVRNEDGLGTLGENAPGGNASGENELVEVPEPVQAEAEETDAGGQGIGGDGNPEAEGGEKSPRPPEADADPEALREELRVLHDRYLRLAAEFTNFRRRIEQERAGLWSRAQGEILGKLLDVLDDLHRVAGLDLENATVEAIMEGIDLVDRKFERILGDAGVEVIDPAGERFDPETMEAMMRVPADSEDDEDRVAMVLQKGYTLNGQLLRPARVSVLKRG